jgi:hypothetical protein
MVRKLKCGLTADQVFGMDGAFSFSHRPMKSHGENMLDRVLCYERVGSRGQV